MDEDERHELFDNWTPPLPPVVETDQGEPRRIGVELEMISLDIEAVSRVVAGHFNGRIKKQTRYEYRVLAEDGSEWGVELDFAYLKQKARAAATDAAGDEDPAEAKVDADQVTDIDQALAGQLDAAAEDFLQAGAELVVPIEVVGPPLPMARLGEVQSLIARLREAGAEGSGASFAYAFGMQFNPELPALDARTIARYLKAFLCLHDWLVQRSAPDLTRRLTRFSAPFPGRYVRRVVDPDYWPDQDTLIDDYLADNPTRNRALDMLPLFLYLDKARLRKVVDDERVKARPTLHYRLPNCDIDSADWGIHLAWADWLQVESLACDEARLSQVCTAYAGWLDKSVGRLFKDWTQEVEAWLIDSNGQ